MTTLAFDGEVFAADSRSTQRVDAGGACSECGDVVHKLHFTNMKLQRPKGVVFRNQKVVAWATAGRVSSTKFLKAMVTNHVTPKAAEEMLAALGSKPALGRLAILTEESFWELSVSDNDICVREVVEFPYAAGNGDTGALVAMTHMGKTATEAVAVAASVDKSTGGKVYWTSRTSKKINQHTAKE